MKPSTLPAGPTAGTARAQRWLSRWRIDLPTILVVPLLALARPTPPAIAAWLPLLLVGLAIRVWARGHLERAAQVTCTGPYAWVRHPLYVGSFLIGIAIAGMTRIPLLPLGVAIGYVVMYWPKALREEAWMREQFGEAYAAYAAQVGAVVPRWRRPRGLAGPGVGQRFAWRRVRRHREWKTWLGAAAIVGLLLARALLPSRDSVSARGSDASAARP